MSADAVRGSLRHAGAWMVRAGMNEEAIDELQKAIALDSRHMAAAFIMIEAYHALGRIDDALAAAEPTCPADEHAGPLKLRSRAQMAGVTGAPVDVPVT